MRSTRPLRHDAERIRPHNRSGVRLAFRHSRGAVDVDAILRLLPIMWSTGTGSEIMQRIAVPMIGGMISSTLLTLIVIPAIYGLVRQRGLRSESSAGDAAGL